LDPEIKYVLKNNPPKQPWRGNSVQITGRKPAKTALAGKNIRGQHELPRESSFGGESRHNRDPRNG